jgi:hypothetical protein
MEARLTLGRPSENFEDKMNSPGLHLGRSLSISDGGNLNGVNDTIFATG